MPANLTPMYRKAEREYRQAQTVADQVACLQQMLQLIPRHKGTDKLQAWIKSSLASARHQLRQQDNAPKSGQTFRLPRQGSGRIVIIGAPNSGKSTVMATLTNANPEIAPFPYTTRAPLPAMMDFEGVQVQLVDTPPVVTGQVTPWMLNLVRTADAALLTFNGSSDDAPLETVDVINEFAERHTVLSNHTGFDPNDFGVAHIRTLLICTHENDQESGERLELFRECCDFSGEQILIESDSNETNVDLASKVFECLNLVRVFTKPPGCPPDLTRPLTIPVDGTVEDLAIQIHEDLARSFRHARLWGHGDHDGQIIGRDHVLRDGDVVELH